MLLLAAVYVVVNLVADVLTVLLVSTAPDAPHERDRASRRGRRRRLGTQAF